MGAEVASLQPAMQRYSRTAVAFHWIIATIIIYQLAVGMVMEHVADPHVRVPIVQLHGSLGVAVLLLSLARLAWRLSHRPPAYDPRLTAPEKRAAHVVAIALYALMIAMPLAGWAILSASARVLKAGMFLFWSGLRWPALPVISALHDPQLTIVHDRFVWLHWSGGVAMIALLLGHVAGALKHHYWDGHRSLGRMWFAQKA